MAKCPAPKGEAQESSLAKGILPATSYLTLPSKLPELKHKEGYQVTTFNPLVMKRYLLFLLDLGVTPIGV